MTPNTNTAPKGKTMLKVVGILYIVFAAINIILGLITIVSGGAAAAAGADAGLGAIIIVAGLVVIVGSILGLVAGILGVKNCDKPEKAQSCFILGIVLLVFAIINLISSFTGDGNIFTSLIGLVLPILYTLGAYWNKQSGSSTVE